jgi:hypothetical protein
MVLSGIDVHLLVVCRCVHRAASKPLSRAASKLVAVKVCRRLYAWHELPVGVFSALAASKLMPSRGCKQTHAQQGLQANSCPAGAASKLMPSRGCKQTHAQQGRQANSCPAGAASKLMLALCCCRRLPVVCRYCVLRRALCLSSAGHNNSLPACFLWHFCCQWLP